MLINAVDQPDSETFVPGMGAFPLPKGGVGFRVWAPNADAVAVVGSFNQWDPSTNLLIKYDSGHWFAGVESAKAGDEYKFEISHGGQKFRRVDPRARQVTNSAGNGIIWWPETPTDSFSMPPQNEIVIYELHVGSFNAAKGTPGTFDSVIQKLPYLRDLGVNTIEVMPIAEFAGDFSWGYNPAHPFAVESAYGGPEGFRALVKAAHKCGIGVILDVVYNHFGPSDLSLWQFDGWSENNAGGIYFYNDWKAKTPWGDSRPDYGRKEVREYIRDNALMWLTDFNVDGLRLDMSVYIRTVSGNHGNTDEELKDGWSLMQWVNDELRKSRPSFFTVAEDLHDSEWLVKGTGAGGAGFNAQWDAAFVHPVRAALISAEDKDRHLDAVLGALRASYDGDAFKRVVYDESHDEVANGKARLPSEIDGESPGSYHAKKRSLLGAALTLVAPGIPMLFQGQEFLEDEWFRDSVPVDWTKLEKFGGIHRAYRDLIALRLNRGGQTKGLTGAYLMAHHVNHERKVLALHRRNEGGPSDDVVIVLNLSSQAYDKYEVGVPAAGLWRVRFNSDSSQYSEDFVDQRAVDCEAVVREVDGMAHCVVTGLAAYSLIILSQDA